MTPTEYLALLDAAIEVQRRDTEQLDFDLMRFGITPSRLHLLEAWRWVLTPAPKDTGQWAQKGADP